MATPVTPTARTPDRTQLTTSVDALDLLSGDARAFLADAWASHAQVHKADVDRLRALLSIDDVDCLLTSTALRAPALRLAKDGKVLSASTFTRQATIAGERLTGLVDARKVIRLFDEGATLVLQGLHRYWPPLTELVRDLERALGHPCQANAYLTPRGSQGFALHEDTHDVFVFQTHGTKQWEIHDQGTPKDVLMEPGTSMYLPTGTPHAARAQETASLHVTIGINQTTYRAALERIVSGLLEADAYADRLPAGWLDEPAHLAAGLQQHLRRLADDLGGLDSGDLADREVTRFLTTRSPQLRGAVVDAVSADSLDDETRVARRSGSVGLLRPADSPDRVTLLLGDRELGLPAWVRPAVEQVLAVHTGETMQPRDLAGVLDPDSRLVLVRRLVREGLLRITG
jgi:lysine-specific demethylase/histidyl-hydroxylase NO66